MRRITIFIVFYLLSLSLSMVDAKTPLRRPVSPQQPMYLVHIDTWNYADPQKIIDLIPEDIRPYVVMNISLSISHNVETSQFQVAEYGYEIAKSWLRTCAQNNMWAIVQHASGGFAQFSDFDLSVYNEFYRDYPNLIGINYAEQFWGYDDNNDPLSPRWSDRMNHLANLLELSNRYGGYLIVSWCGNRWSTNINPIGMLKRNAAFAEACELYTENYLLFEKYTQESYQSDMESLCLGAYLSGYSGNYGIRYDNSGWTGPNGVNEDFTMATAGAVHLEHMMLTGSTMIDGPELIWTQCFRETNRQSTTNGYTKRNWETFPQFINVTVDIFRKILDGTVRIPSREEVVERTKFVVINDVNSGSGDQVYSSPETLFEGLYRMDGDGNYWDNKSFFKKTGRYPTIPTVYNLNDSLAKSFPFQIKRSQYASRWPSISSKVQEFDAQFPQEYTGDLYAGRHENGWVIYNPFKTGQTASASIPFKYNTSERVDLTFSQYTASVMKEYSDRLTFYLSNYDNELNTGLKTDVIKIYGSTVEPTFTYKDRGDHQPSVVNGSWSEGVFTLTVQHNGALDVEIACSGTATNRLTNYTEAVLIEPVAPPVYTGPRQYEAECFDYKSISSVTTGGQYGSIRNYTGQGYLRMGTNAGASVRDTVHALRSGMHRLDLRYAVIGGNVSTMNLYVNGTKAQIPVFRSTESESDWAVYSQMVELKAGANEIMLIANRAGSYSLLLDNMVISQDGETNVYHFEQDPASTEASTPPAELIGIQSGSAGVVTYTDVTSQVSKGLKSYSVAALNGTGVADLEMFSHTADDYHVVWKDFGATVGAKRGVLMRATGEPGACAYAEGMKQGYLFIVHNDEQQHLVLKPYVAGADGLTALPTHTSSFTVDANAAYWLRASAYGNQFKFECSLDSMQWEGGSSTLFVDDTYRQGGSQLVWGLNANNYSWIMDNLIYKEGQISTSKIHLTGLDYTQGHGPSPSASFEVSAAQLYDTLKVSASEPFEVSLSENVGYDATVDILPVLGAVTPTTVFVRMKGGLNIDAFEGAVRIHSNLVSGDSVRIQGVVTPAPVSRLYTFTHDRVASTAQTPPAQYLSVGSGSSATAGVVSFTDSRSFASNMFKPFSGGQRNATGAVTLDRFSKTATDYSITWKQCVNSGTSDYKVGMLLRGDASKVGDASTGYVQGMMHGYLLLVYTANGGTNKETQFRIYRSTEAYNALTMMVNSSVNSLIATARQPIWYRASVSGTSPVSLKIEYSTDSIHWNIGASSSDVGSEVFTAGSSQIIWGLGAGDVTFFLDDILFDGVESAAGANADALSVSNASLSGFSYVENSGPSASQTFVLSGNTLVDDIHLDAPKGYELSLSPSSGYASYLSVKRSAGLVAETTVYVRLKSGLVNGAYEGALRISSVNALDQFIQLIGAVDRDPNAINTPSVTATVVSSEYYALSGQRLQSKPETSGIYIVKEFMSDNTVVIRKIRN